MTLKVGETLKNGYNTRNFLPTTKKEDMQIEKNKQRGALSVLLGGPLFSQLFFFDDNFERNEELYRSYILPYLKKGAEGDSASETSPDSESADYSFVNLRPLFEHAMRKSGMPEGGKDARMFRDVYNAFDTMAVGLEKNMTRGANFSKADLTEPFARFANTLNDIAKTHNAGR